jgi:hypothetical protein
VALCRNWKAASVNLTYIYIFSPTFHPAISPAFGTGKPYLETVVIAETERCEWQQLGIRFVDQHLSATAPLAVLHESDALLAVWLIVIDDGQHWEPIVVELDKNQISATKMVDPLAKKMPTITSLPMRCEISSSGVKKPQVLGVRTTDLGKVLY